MKEEKDLHETERMVNLLDMMLYLVKRGKVIALVTSACFVVAAAVVLLLPNVYRAEARILPPQQGSSSVLTSQFLNQVAGGLTGLGSLLGANNQTDLYVGMLQSRTLLDGIISRFELKKSYRTDTLDETRKKLRKRINALADPKSNIIVITVEDKDPQRAADMANAFVEELRKLMRGLAVTEAAQRRLFFEDQLKSAKENLAGVEERMKDYQEKTGALHVEEQVKSVIRSIAQLRAEIAAKEVEIRVTQTYSTANNPDLQRAQEAVRGMKAELAKLETKHGSGGDALVSAGRMPSVGAEYVRKLRDLKFNEALYELLLKQYELAKLDEARDAVVIQVVDTAVRPEKKIGPNRIGMLASAAVLGFLVSLAAVFFSDYRRKILADAGNRERIEQLKRHFHDLAGREGRLTDLRKVFSLKKHHARDAG